MTYFPKEKYDFKYIEKIISNFWKNRKFKKRQSSKKISILMPPPNITGELHLGHALNNFIQDALIRFYKIKGYQTLWIPGLDHAGIATEITVKKWIAENKWKIQNDDDWKFYFNKWFGIKKEAIIKQWNQLGLMFNEEWFSFTLDDNFQTGIKKAFVKLYQSDLIYQDQRLINFDLKLQTAISDIEVNHIKTKGKMYYIKYWTKDQKKFVVVATTRPETIFADQALAVHPEDKRYFKWLNEKFINPLTNKELLLIVSKKVDFKIGTGILKCTPGHDFTDFTIAKANNLLSINCFDNKGILNNLAGSFAGLDRLVARPMIVQNLEKKGHLVKIELIEHNLPFSSRTDSLVEPTLSQQWFLKIKNWAQKMIEDKEKINFYPIKYFQNFLNWMNNCEDWCISRQLKWGHKMPVYYNSKKQIKVSVKKPIGKDWKQSKDVLDTWFSSGLWSLINFGWNNPSRKILKSFLPTSFLVTSYDIIFFWVARMLFLHQYFWKQIPFQKILIHGLIRTEKNEKMSKSKGNSVNPDSLISEFGVDSLRLYFLTQHKFGDDLKFQKEKLIQANQFCNKIWNINIFIEQNKIQIDDFYPHKCVDELNYYICQKFLLMWKKISIHWTKHLWSVLFDELTQFIWKVFGNEYLELAKTQLKQKNNCKETLQTINFIWNRLLIILHPFLPFLTEFLWQKYYPKESILEVDIKLNKVSKFYYSRKLPVLEAFQKIVKEIKNVNLKTSKTKNLKKIHLQTNRSVFFRKNIEKINQWLKKYNYEITEIFSNNVEKIIFLDETNIDIDKQILFFQNELSRSEKILSNPFFLKKAKLEIVSKEMLKKTKNQKKLIKLLKIKNKSK